jgi:phage-related protein
MAFPILRTGAVAQYPAARSLRFQNQTLRFLDGTEQRYRDSAGVLHRWQIRFDGLDEREITALEDFFSECQGTYGTFAFTDPWDGEEYPNCSLEVDGFDLVTLGEMQVAASVVVVENR